MISRSIEDLDRAVEEGLRHASSALFSMYWRRARKLMEGKPIRGWYIRHSEGYMNVATITDTALLDVEAKDADAMGYFALLPLDAINNLSLHEGALTTFPATAGARMTVAFNRTPVGLDGYWIATTEKEAEDLLVFVECLGDAVLALRER